MSNGNWLSSRFWAVIIAIGVVMGVVAGFAAFNVTFSQVADRMAGVVDFAKSQSLTYDSFNDASTTKSLLRSIESAGQLARDVSQDGGATDAESLQRYACELSLTAALVLTPEGDLVGSYSSDEVGYAQVESELRETSALDVARYPLKTYATRIELEDGSHVDVGCSSRLDAPGVVVSLYRTKPAFGNRYSLTLQSMVEGYSTQNNGCIVVENDGNYIAANTMTLAQLQSEGIGDFDKGVISAIKERCTLGKASVINAESTWFIASFDKGRDYYVYTYTPLRNNLGGVALSVALALALYAVFVILVVLLRRQSEHEHLRELVAQEHEYSERLAEAAREAQSANTAKTEFLQRMSHDIRTPINGIRGMVEIGNVFDGDVAKQRECRQKIWMASGILLDLVSEVLDMSKLESGEVELELRSTNLVALNDEVCEMLERQAGELHVTIIKEQDRIEHPYVMASQTHLKRVIMNIASNAVKYNKPGGTVRLSCEELHAEGATAMYRITVADTGIGMSKDFQQHLFEPFSREVQKLEAQPSGTGLGTVIAKQLTELMGGAITFDSELDVGTTCVITLPLVIDFDAQQRNEELDKQGDVTLAGMSILLVEDNELNREIAEFVLDQAGAHVTTAFDGREAVDAFAAAAPGTFDLVLMDIMMPNVNGYEATRAIRAMNRTDAKRVPIVAMSANAFADDVAYSRESGMNDHVAKPIDADKLVRVLARYRKDA